MFVYCGNDPVDGTDLHGKAFSTEEDADGDGIPDYLMLRWLTMTYRAKANCYAFAFKMANDPRTGDAFTQKPQPGEFSGISLYNSIYNLQEQETEILLVQINRIIIDAVVADGETLGFTIVPVDSADYPTQDGQWLVALAFGSDDYGFDYHWWRKMDNGFWYHKPGSSPVRNKDSSGQLIKDPGMSDRGMYQYFFGYYLVTPTP